MGISWDLKKHERFTNKNDDFPWDFTGILYGDQ